MFIRFKNIHVSHFPKIYDKEIKGKYTNLYTTPPRQS